MANPIAIVRQVVSSDSRNEGAMLYFWCPGCDKLHGVGILGRDGSHARTEWGFNNDMDNPTVSPSILVQWTEGEQREEKCCHSHLRNGQWHFLGDCSHTLANQVVDMVPLPDWMCRERSDRWLG